MTRYQLDPIDRKILALLVKDARMPFLEIAREATFAGKKAGIKIPPYAKVLNYNLLILTEAAWYKKICASIATVVGKVCAFISVSLSENNKYMEVVNALKHVEEIVECHFITGRATLLLKVYCLDNDHLMEVLLNTIQKIPFVQATDTMISLDEAFERQVWVKDYKSTSFFATSKS